MGYTYLFTDLLTDTVLAELPLSGTAYSRQLNGPGGLDATLNVAGLQAALQSQWEAATRPWRTAVWVDRDGLLVYGGPVITRRWQSASRTVSLGSSDWSAYLGRRSLRTRLRDLGVDQFQIARDIVAQVQAVPFGNVGLAVSSGASGVLRDVTYEPWERKWALEALTELAEQDNGFDWRLDVAYGGPTGFLRTLVLGYPQLGAPAETTGLVFAKPGAIIDYAWPEDGSLTATTVDALGNGEGTNMLISTAATAGMLGTWPVLEAQVSYKDERVKANLDAKAAYNAAGLSGDTVLPVLTVRADSEPRLGTYNPGDMAKISVVDERFPAGMDTVDRIATIKVTPATSTEPDSVELTMAATR